MRILNKIVKFFGYVGIHILTFVESYLMSLLFTSPIICVVLSVLNAITKTLPETVTERFWIMYLVMCIPLAIIFFILIVLDVTKRFSKK